jgi:hypothetical protein
MITPKTTALILAMTIVGAATPAAFAQTIPGIGVVTATLQESKNSDDDTNTQGNAFAPEVKSEQESKQNSGTQGSAFTLNALTGANTNLQTSAQTVSASQSNTVNDNDNQTSDQCATGPSVIPIIPCASLDAGAELPDIGGLLGGATETAE